MGQDEMTQEVSALSPTRHLLRANPRGGGRYKPAYNPVPVPGLPLSRPVVSWRAEEADEDGLRGDRCQSRLVLVLGNKPSTARPERAGPSRQQRRRVKAPRQERGMEWMTGERG